MVELFPKDVRSQPGLDRLTGLPDRGECLSRLISTLAQHHGRDDAVSVFWLNVDRFRQINNSFGHIVGDSVLIELARRLERAKPDGSVLARMGADEFVLIASCVGADDAEHIGRNLLTAIGQALGVGTRRVRPSASIGIALVGSEDSASELLERADRAMLEAKREGGGRCSLVNPQAVQAHGSKHLAREELSVEEMLHRALETGGLYLEYQPIVRAEDRSILAVESLMRCRVGDGVIPPGRFIPVAEKTGLIMHLGDWGLVTAGGFVRRLAQQGQHLKVAVNVSRAQLQTTSFTKSLHGMLAYTGIEAAQMELEITESLFMDASTVVQDNLRAAMEAGVSLALDDFGTGFSSLACLKDLPAHKIKLDRAFVVGLPNDRRAFSVAKAVAQLASDLGITVVAEGVETAEQYESLCEAGVTAIQGFHVAHPMGEAQLLNWLSTLNHD